ncbi:MAG: PD40 domain-containing protein [Vicingus serpentipes]|nr:PD40 domain-containing protein [Vicingus serpentipes]
MYKSLSYFLVIVHLFFTFSLVAQETSSLKAANQFFNDNNFNAALNIYLSNIADNKEDQKFNYRVGVCYLNTNIDKSNAIPYLEKALSIGEPDPNTYYLLGRAYHFAYRFNDAIKMFGKFKALNKGDIENIENVDKQIEYCYNAIEIMKFPLDVVFDNLGPNINSVGPDYYPFIPKDESFLVFNSKRDDGSSKEANGNFFSEIYLSEVKNGAFSKAIKLDQNINTLDGTEEVVGLSATGDYILFYYENKMSYGDLYIAEYNLLKGAYEVEKLPKVINSKGHEIAASISRFGDVIYFASDREGGYGGVDLYVSRKLPNGKWSTAQNLGPSINTKDDEDFPNISPDNKTLYFSSKGHTSMGGYDIFKANWDPVKRNWTDIKNIGFPINTPEDNMNYRESKTGRTGYISALRAGGYGDLDIYSVTFNEVDMQYTVFKGYINDKEAKEIIKDVFISVIDLQSDEEYGNYMTNPQSGRYVMILPPGKYNVLVEVPGYKTYMEDIEVYGKGSFRSMIKKDFELEKAD